MMNSFKNLSKRISWNFFRKLIITLFILFIANLSAVFTQTNTGRISGVVMDSNGAVVANATVSAFDQATNFSRVAMTDENGFYTLSNLPVAVYTISIEAPNFKKSVKTENTLSADARLTVDFTLEAGQISEIVEVVQRSGETVNTTSGEVSKVIDRQQVQNLALNGRNYYQLLSLIPGAVITQEDQIDTNLATNTININGNRGVSK